MNTDKTTSTKSHLTIKLGIDVHAKWYYVARQLDAPHPLQKMALDGLPHFVAKQQGLTEDVHSSYEAGVFGCYLHRKFVAMGRSLLAMHGIHNTGKWWKGETWAMIRSDMNAGIIPGRSPG